MYYLLAFVCGIIAGAIGAVVYYRRNVALIESELKIVSAARDKAVEMYNDLKSKVGG